MMTANGLAKLMEECGELIQISAKKLAYFNTDKHPDGVGSLSARMEEEIADVRAACQFVTDQFQLNKTRIDGRLFMKLELFERWHADKSNQADPYHDDLAAAQKQKRIAGYADAFHEIAKLLRYPATSQKQDFETAVLPKLRKLMAAEKRVAKLEAALSTEIAAIREYHNGSSHFEDCWKTHRRCAAVRRMEAALAGQGGAE